MSQAPPADHRVVLLAPSRRDGDTAMGFLREAGITVEVTLDFETAIDTLRDGAAAFVVAEESLTPDTQTVLITLLLGQPPWSDLPVLVLARPGVDSLTSADAVRTLGNVTLLERPLRVATFLSAIHTAIRARRRQYQIRDHLDERARAETELRVSDRRKDEFLATLGHELRNPLAPIVSALSLLRLQRGLTPVTTQAIDIIERQASHLTALVDDLLEVSRITRGMVTIHRVPVDLVQAVQSAVETARPAIERLGHRLELDLPPVAPVEGDLLRLTQIVANLLTNAAKYTDPGGRIRVAVQSRGRHVTVAVRDSGIGIAAEHLQRVFDMFTQIDREHRSAQGGLGIGLTLVRSLVELHGGTVEARSAGPGMGSEFVVDLPALDTSLAAATTRQPPRRLPGLRVMVVDDNVDAAETLALLLEALGATVRVAHDGATALQWLDSFAPEALLLDIGMPRLDGYELARRIRARPPYRHTPLIALTGWGQDHDLVRSREAGFDHHVVKPPDLDRLLDLLSCASQTNSRSAAVGSDGEAAH